MNASEFFEKNHFKLTVDKCCRNCKHYREKTRGFTNIPFCGNEQINEHGYSINADFIFGYSICDAFEPMVKNNENETK